MTTTLWVFCTEYYSTFWLAETAQGSGSSTYFWRNTFSRVVCNIADDVIDWHFVSSAWLVRLWEVTSNDGVAVIVSAEGNWNKDMLHSHLENRFRLFVHLRKLVLPVYYMWCTSSCLVIKNRNAACTPIQSACIWAVRACFVGVWKEGDRRLVHVWE